MKCLAGVGCFAGCANVQLFIRNLTPEVIARLKRKADARAVSLETFLQSLLAEAAQPSLEEQLVELPRVRGLDGATERMRGVEKV